VPGDRRVPGQRGGISAGWDPPALRRHSAGFILPAARGATAWTSTSARRRAACSVRVLIAELPTCGYRCVNAHIRRRAEPRRLHVADDKRLNLVLREQSLPAWRHRAGLNLDVLPRGCDDPIVKSASRIGTDSEALQRPGT
jgi:hypothetical protein